MKTIIVDAPHVEAAGLVFPGHTIMGVRVELEPDQIESVRGQSVVLWCHNSGTVAQDLSGVASEIGVISEERWLPQFRGSAAQALLWARQHVSRYNPQVTNGAAVQPAPAQPAPMPNGRPVLGVVESDGSVRAAAPKPEPDLPAGFSEDALAVEFTHAHPELRYCADWGKWLAWDGGRWAIDNTLNVFDKARMVCRSAAQRAIDAGVNGAKTIMSARTHAAVERIARSDAVHAVSGKIWDADPWLLNTPSGVVDLNSGQLRAATASEHMTKITRVGPSDVGPARWLSFLVDATNHDMELLKFLQRMAGYCLTGITRDHALFFAYGEGGNGKGTFMNTLSWILGDYAHAASMETFTETRGERHSTEIASMMGARMVTAQETEEGRRWNEQRLTSLTGGDPVRARFMRQDEFEFLPQFKLLMSGNHKPGLRNVNEAIRRRLHLIPFTVVVPPDKRDPMLTEKLRAEAGGILTWCIQGCLEWQRIGLVPPACVKAATEDYLENQDSMGTWITECCETEKTFETTVGDLYKSFAQWAEQNGEFVLSRRRFSDAVQSRGFAVEQRGGKYRVKGIHVVPAPGTTSGRGTMFDD